ncbi:hypothetical protein SNEBB_000447 [Seison nebaliae]|nr:hypothetical protein SNEBB_000447 [Seison nebaliae]
MIEDYTRSVTRSVDVDQLLQSEKTALNKAIWSRGVKNVPFRIRVRLTKKRNHDDEATEKFFILVSYVPVESFKGLITRNVDNVEADE